MPTVRPTRPDAATPQGGRNVEGEPSTLLSVWARPAAPRAGIVWDEWRGAWIVSVRAPAVDGQANRAILELLEERLGVMVRFVHAGRSPRKSVRVQGLRPEEVRARLSRT